MKDILLLEKCKHCDSHLTLMESQNQNGEVWLVIRCLVCGNHKLKEIIEVKA